LSEASIAQQHRPVLPSNQLPATNLIRFKPHSLKSKLNSS